MGLRRRITHLTRKAEEGAVLIRLRDGTSRVFDDLTCWKEMFLARFSLFKGEAHESPVLDAVRAATPESRRPLRPNTTAGTARKRRDGFTQQNEES